VLTIEVTSMEGEPGMQVTGQLGDVMSESAQIALSFVRANAEDSGRERRVHASPLPLARAVGCVPKDGPSAGITMTTALASLVTGRPVKGNLGMTREVTLQGRVLPIWRCEAEAACRATRRTHRRDHPADNEPDLDDVPEQVREQLNVHPVHDVRECLRSPWPDQARHP
jgi:ATP-dependent Lon protease